MNVQSGQARFAVLSFFKDAKDEKIDAQFAIHAAAMAGAMEVMIEENIGDPLDPISATHFFEFLMQNLDSRSYSTCTESVKAAVEKYKRMPKNG